MLSVFLKSFQVLVTSCRMFLSWSTCVRWVKCAALQKYKSRLLVLIVYVWRFRDLFLGAIHCRRCLHQEGKAFLRLEWSPERFLIRTLERAAWTNICITPLEAPKRNRRRGVHIKWAAAAHQAAERWEMYKGTLALVLEVLVEPSSSTRRYVRPHGLFSTSASAQGAKNERAGARFYCPARSNWTEPLKWRLKTSMKVTSANRSYNYYCVYSKNNEFSAHRNRTTASELPMRFADLNYRQTLDVGRPRSYFRGPRSDLLGGASFSSGIGCRIQPSLNSTHG